MLFLKKGIDKAAGQPIYPHPNQTKTGNCAAYTGAACLYAFGLDHEPGLIPSGTGGTAGENFQFKIAKMVERLTQFIYTERNSVARGYRKYIDAMGLTCKFDVTEVPVLVYEYDHIAGRRSWLSNIGYIIEQMKACQDIMLHIRWGASDWNIFGTTYRHSVGLVGIDEATQELILNNPWGNTVHVNPTDAAKNTEQGTGERFTRYKYTVDGDGYIHITFDGKDAYIYECVMICPAKPHVVTVESKAAIVTPPRTPKMPGAPRPRAGEAEIAGGNRRYSYTLVNNVAKAVNGFAIGLPGLGPENIVAIQSPKGWTAAPWYRDRETGFDQPAPDAEIDRRASNFAGVLWRTESRALGPDDQRDGFALELDIPRGEGQGNVGEWEDDTLGQAIALFELPGATTAWHIWATTPGRKRYVALPPDSPEPPTEPTEPTEPKPSKEN